MIDKIKHEINIYNKTKTKIKKNILENIVEKSLDILKIKNPCEATLFLVDDKFITDLNRKYRGLNEPTDVLTFAILDKKRKRIDSPDSILHLGDIVVSLDAAERQSRECLHSFNFAIAILLVHGLLHSFGYAHDNKKTKNKMDYWSEKILRQLITDKIVNR